MTLVIVSANIDLSVGYGCRVARCDRSDCTRLVGATDSRHALHRYLHRHPDGTDARLPRRISANPGVYRHTRWIFGVSWLDAGIYQGRDHPAPRQLAQSDWQRLPLADTRMGTYGRRTRHQWLPILPTARRTATIRYGTSLSAHVPIENGRNMGTDCLLHRCDEYSQRRSVSGMHPFRTGVRVPFHCQPHPFRTVRLCSRRQCRSGVPFRG